MNKKQFSVEEVISFLEILLETDTATEDEQILYQDYIWNNKLKRNSTYMKIQHKMRKWHFGKV